MTSLFLFISGLLLLIIGVGILFIPHAFHAGNGILLGNDPSLLSEIRAPGGLLLGSAIIIFMGAFRNAWRAHAISLTILVFGSFGLARLVGMALDGMPSSGIIGATLIELVVAALGLMIYWRQHNREAVQSSNELNLSKF